MSQGISEEIDLLCTDPELNKGPKRQNKCDGIMQNVGSEDSRYNTRLKCKKCQRVFELSLEALNKKIAKEKQKRYNSRKPIRI